MPTEQAQRDQRSDVRKRIDEYLTCHRVAGVGSFIASVRPSVTLDRRDIESVLADADRDRQFVEEVEVLIRQHVACANHECNGTRPLLATLCQFVRNRYAPCTAKEKG